GREMRVRRGEEEGGPVDILRCELSARQQDEHELATLKRRENVFAHEQRVAVPNPLVGQDLQEVVVVDRAIRIENVLARHFPALVEDVNFLELSPSDLLQRSGHEDSGDDWAEASDYETGEQSFDRPLHTLAALVARASPRGRVRRNRAARALFKKRALVISREKGRSSGRQNTDGLRAVPSVPCRVRPRSGPVPDCR